MGKILLSLGALLVLFFGMKFINEVRTYGTIGTAPMTPNTIDVSGEGEAFAIPDVATLGFSVEEKAKTIKEAQDIVTKKIDTVLTFLKESGVAEKDIKTANYNVYPEYVYQQPCYTSPCPVAKEPQLVGYHVGQTITVKVRDTAKIGTVIEGISTRGITNLTGPDFTVDDPDGVKAEARKEAIDDAQAKAKILAKDLHVRLVRIARFTESNGGYYPQAYMAKDSGYGMGGGAPEVQVPVGENKFTSNVTITYEIR